MNLTDKLMAKFQAALAWALHSGECETCNAVMQAHPEGCTPEAGLEMCAYGRCLSAVATGTPAVKS